VILLLVEMHASATDERTVLVQGYGESESVTIRRSAEQNLGVFFGIRVRNSQSRSRDFSRANERNERRDVGPFEWPEQQSFGM
jgi:hypothetical protein